MGKLKGVGGAGAEGEEGSDALGGEEGGIGEGGRVGAEGHGELAIGEPLVIDTDAAAHDVLMPAGGIPRDADARTEGLGGGVVDLVGDLEAAVRDLLGEGGAGAELEVADDGAEGGGGVRVAVVVEADAEVECEAGRGLPLVLREDAVGGAGDAEAEEGLLARGGV